MKVRLELTPENDVERKIVSMILIARNLNDDETIYNEYFDEVELPATVLKSVKQLQDVAWKRSAT